MIPQKSGLDKALKTKIVFLRISSDLRWITALALIPFLLFRAGNGNYLALGDNFLDLHPTIDLIMDLVKDGQAPFWNPYLCAGVPIAGYGNVSPYYPLYWMHFFLPTVFAFNITLYLSYFLASLGIFFFARRWNFSRPSAFFSGVCYGYGAFMLGWLHAMEAVGPALWLGWFFLCVERLRTAFTRNELIRNLALSAVVVALMMVSGHPQIALYSCMSALLYVFYFVLTGKARPHFLWLFFVTLLLGVMLAAPHLLPGLTLSAESYRRELSYEKFISPTVTVFQFLGGIFFINAQPNLYFSAYIGIVPFAFIIAAVSYNRKHQLIFPSILIIFIAILLAMGGITGIDKLLFHVPGYNLFSFHTRHTVEMSFFSALLAGLGLDTIILLRKSPLEGLKKFLFLFLAVSMGASFLFLTDYKPNERLFFAPLLAFFSLFLFGFVIKKLDEKFLFLPAGLVALVPLIEAYVTYLRPKMPFNRSENVLMSSPVAEAIKSREKSHIPPSRLFTLYSLEGGNWELMHAGAQSNLAMRMRINSTNGYVPTMLRRYKETTKLDFLGHPEVLFGFFDSSNLALDLLSTRYFSYDTEKVVPYMVEGKFLSRHLQVDSIRFADPIQLTIGKENPYEMWLPPFETDSLAIVSSIGEHAEIKDGENVAKFTLTADNGKEFSVFLKAGEHTAYHYYDSLVGTPPPLFTVGEVPYFGFKLWYLKPGDSEEFKRPPFRANALALLSYLVFSDEMKNGDSAVTIELYSAQGEKQSVVVRAGMETADWAIEDVTRHFRHSSPTLFRQLQPEENVNIKGRDYPTIIRLSKPMEVARVKISNPHSKAIAVIEDATLIGEEDDTFSPLFHPGFPSHRKAEPFPWKSGMHNEPNEYLGIVKLTKAVIPVKLKMESLLPTGYLYLSRLSLCNFRSGMSHPIGYIEASLSDTSRFKPIIQGKRFALVENVRAMPRAWLVDEAMILSFEQIVRAIHKGVLPNGANFDPFKTVLLEGTPPLPPYLPTQSSSGIGDRVVFRRYRANEIVLAVSSSSNKWLVLSETYYPGWRASVDGIPWHILPANGMLRSIQLPAGVHSVEMRFFPPRQIEGWFFALSAAFILGILGMINGFEPKNGKTK